MAYYDGSYYVTADDGNADDDEPDHVYRLDIEEGRTDVTSVEELVLDDVIKQGLQEKLIMPRILVVDDEPDICQMIRRYAEHDGYETVGVTDGTEAVSICRKEDFDIIIMDVMMPDMDGLSACKRIREMKDIPVLMLSARGQEYDKLFGFEVGADDYVTKPFSPKELMARINVIIRRHKKSVPSVGKETEKLKFDGIEIDVPGHNFYVDGVKTELTAKEYELLLYFINNRGIALTREQILSAVWDYAYFGDDRTVDWQVKLLRNKLGKYREMIHTVRGVGYKFDE